MSERKYRQHGYQDDDRRPPRASAPRPSEPHDPRLPRDPRAPNMPGFRDRFRCARCGQEDTAAEIGADSTCRKCGMALHACIQCACFDAGSRFECREPVPARISAKDARNECRLYTPRVSVERETGSTPSAGTRAVRKAFDDLFKF
jgi:hypothetical protein